MNSTPVPWSMLTPEQIIKDIIKVKKFYEKQYSPPKPESMSSTDYLEKMQNG